MTNFSVVECFKKSMNICQGYYGQKKKSMQEELNIIHMLLPVPINNSINRENAWSSEFFSLQFEYQVFQAISKLVNLSLRV